jgi:hypothetical protein
LPKSKVNLFAFELACVDFLFANANTMCARAVSLKHSMSNIDHIDTPPLKAATATTELNVVVEHCVDFISIGSILHWDFCVVD